MNLKGFYSVLQKTSFSDTVILLKRQSSREKMFLPEYMTA